jgi:hypothetical protein
MSPTPTQNARKQEPRRHLIRYHGVPAPHAADRALIVPTHSQAPPDNAPRSANPTPPRSTPMAWARLLARLILAHALQCARCGARMHWSPPGPTRTPYVPTSPVSACPLNRPPSPHRGYRHSHSSTAATDPSRHPLPPGGDYACPGRNHPPGTMLPSPTPRSSLEPPLNRAEPKKDPVPDLKPAHRRALPAAPGH